MATKFIVAEGKVVVCPNTRTLIQAGSDLEEDLFSRSYMAELIDGEYIRLRGSEITEEERKKTAIQSLLENDPDVETPEGSAPAPASAGEWALDPKALKKLDLETLQLMVVDRDQDIETPDTKKAAIELLSRSFAG